MKIAEFANSVDLDDVAHIETVKFFGVFGGYFSVTYNVNFTKFA